MGLMKPWQVLVQMTLKHTSRWRADIWACNAHALRAAGEDTKPCTEDETRPNSARTVLVHSPIAAWLLRVFKAERSERSEHSEVRTPLRADVANLAQNLQEIKKRIFRSSQLTFSANWRQTTTTARFFS